MDSDDVAEPDRIERQVQFICNSGPELVMFGTAFRFYDGIHVSPPVHVPVDHAKIVRRLGSGFAGVCHPTIAFRRSVFLGFGGIGIDGAGEDLDYFLRFARVGKLGNLNAPLLRYRIHKTSLSFSKAVDIACGYDYAIDRFNGRIPEELSFADYRLRWNQSFRKYHSILRRKSNQFYRLSIIESLGGNAVRAWALKAVAALLDPAAVLQRLRLIFEQRFHV
jgi:hypothetical protein